MLVSVVIVADVIVVIPFDAFSTTALSASAVPAVTPLMKAISVAEISAPATAALISLAVAVIPRVDRERLRPALMAYAQSETSIIRAMT